jgi:hypothetical protein
MPYMHPVLLANVLTCNKHTPILDGPLHGSLSVGQVCSHIQSYALSTLATECHAPTNITGGHLQAPNKHTPETDEH